MKHTTVVTDFKDLRKAIEEVTKNKPAKSRYKQQAEKMGYTKDKTVVNEKFTPDKIKGFERATDFYVQFRGGRGDRITSPENKKDFEAAKKMITAYGRKHKLNIKDHPRQRIYGTPQEGSSAYKISLYAKHHTNDPNHDLRPLLTQISKLKTAEDHGGGYDKPINEEIISEASALDGMMDIVKTKGAKKVNGVMIDMFTASVIKQAYDKVNDANKKKMEKANVQTLVKLAQRVMGLNASNEFDKDPLKGFPYNESEFHLFSNKKDADKKAKEIKGKVITGKGKSQGQFMAVKESFDEDLKEENLEEARITITTPMYNELQKMGLPKLMKKHNAYLNKDETDSKHTTISTPSGRFHGEVQNLIKKNLDKIMKVLPESVDLIQEGTWAIPDSYKKLYNLQVGFLQMPSKPTPNNAKRMAKNIYSIFGDDSFFDDLLDVETGEDTETKDLRDLIVKHLEPWGLKFKKGAKYQITHAPQKWIDNMTANPADESVDETAKKRKSGNLKPIGLGRSMKVTLKASMCPGTTEDKLDPVGKADDDIDNDGDVDSSDKYLKKRRAAISKSIKMKEDLEHAKKSPFKLKSQAYPKAVGIDTEGYGTRHATREDIVEACDSFGMITEQELQLEQIQKTLGKQGFLTYNISELNDVFDERETERVILALESVTSDEPLEPMVYTRTQIDEALETETEIEFVKPDGMKAAGSILKMCENTYNVKDKHTGKSFTFKYEDEGRMKTFNQIISEAKFPKKLVRMAGGIAFDKRYVGGNMTGAVKAIEKIKKGLSDDPEVRKMLRLANESFNNEFYNALSEKEKTEYQKFFQSVLKKFGVKSPAELSGDKEKEFYNYVDKNWSGKTETDEWISQDGARRRVKEGDKRKSKDEELNPSKTKIDGRRTNFREKMRKLGYIKAK